MKKFFISFAIVIISLSAIAQDNQYFWHKGKMMFGTPIEQTDSITFENNRETDTLHLLLPKSVFTTDTVFIHDTIYSEIYDTVNIYGCGKGMQLSDKGMLAGLFSVGENKKIHFSSGNLQYEPSQNVWRFATRQYDVKGESNTHIDPTYSGLIDLFGWGSGANPTNASIDYSSYQEFIDWGVNAIINGGNRAHQWRTLTSEEWTYLFCIRPNAEKLFGFGNIATVNGVFLLPDDCSLPEDISFQSASECGFVKDGNIYLHPSASSYTLNTYSIEEWMILEATGVVFLPCAGHRANTMVEHVNSCGYYWSSSSSHNGGGDEFYFNTSTLNPQYDFNRGGGLAIRLVQDEISDEGMLPGVFSISNDKQVHFSKGNFQYMASTHTCRFAEHQYDYIGRTNQGISPTYNGWIDLLGWGTGDDPSKSSLNDSDYLDFVDWGANAISNGGNTPNLWRTLTSEEWHYVFMKRANAENLCGLGCIHFDEGDSVNGVILVPDDWSRPKDVNFWPIIGGCCEFFVDGADDYTFYRKETKHSMCINFTCNEYSPEEWKKMEMAGAVFLPACGFRKKTFLTYVNELGMYWSISRNKKDELPELGAYGLVFFSKERAGEVVPTDYMDTDHAHLQNFHYGQSVRLVHEIKK